MGVGELFEIGFPLVNGSVQLSGTIWGSPSTLGQAWGQEPGALREGDCAQRCREERDVLNFLKASSLLFKNREKGWCEQQQVTCSENFNVTSTRARLLPLLSM